MVWYDDTPGNSEIYYMKSTDGGATWTTAQRLTWTSGYSADPAVAADSSGNLHVVWQDDLPGNNEIYYKRVCPNRQGGRNESDNLDIRGTWVISFRAVGPGRLDAGQEDYLDGRESSSPAVAVDSGGAIHVVWSDDTPGNAE